MTLAQALAKEPLYKVLGTIGVKQQSLDPVGLLGYDLLLHCPEVERRVGPDATDLERAGAARDAILAAVKSIEDPTRRLIAEAALCTRPPFIEKLVRDRKKDLPGISNKLYGEERPGAVGFVFGYLSRKDERVAPSPLEPPALNDTSSEQLTYNIFCIKRDALELFCTGMAMLFIADNQVKRAAGVVGVPKVNSRVMDTGPKPLFDALLAFIDTSKYGLIENRDAFKEAMTHNQWWSEVKAEWLLEHADELAAICPLDNGSLTMAGSILGHSNVHRRDLYTEIWRPWFFDNWLTAAPSASAIGEMTAKAGAIAYELANRTGVNQEAEKLAKHDALQIVNMYYDLSCSNKFDAYFNTVGRKLVDELLM
jgi:hypothetical protein